MCGAAGKIHSALCERAVCIRCVDRHQSLRNQAGRDSWMQEWKGNDNRERLNDAFVAGPRAATGADSGCSKDLGSYRLHFLVTKYINEVELFFVAINWKTRALLLAAPRAKRAQETTV
jgi:hypothetical protein